MCLSPLLAGCMTSGLGVQRTNIPDVPTHYRECFDEVAKLPVPKGGWTLPKLTRAFTALAESEQRKSQCGRDVVAWADDILGTIRSH